MNHWRRVPSGVHQWCTRVQPRAPGEVRERMSGPNVFDTPVQVVDLTHEQALAFMVEAEVLFDKPENKAQVDQMASMVQPGAEMMVVVMAMPMVTEILGPILPKYGFPTDNSAMMVIMAALKKLMVVHQDVRARMDALKGKFLPPAVIPVADKMFFNAN